MLHKWLFKPSHSKWDTSARWHQESTAFLLLHSRTAPQQGSCAVTDIRTKLLLQPKQTLCPSNPIQPWDNLKAISQSQSHHRNQSFFLCRAEWCSSGSHKRESSCPLCWNLPGPLDSSVHNNSLPLLQLSLCVESREGEGRDILQKAFLQAALLPVVLLQVQLFCSYLQITLKIVYCFTSYVQNKHILDPQQETKHRNQITPWQLCSSSF